jgi:hypothetical protein
MNRINFYGSRITNLQGQTQGFLIYTDDRAGNSNWIEATLPAARAIKLLCGTTSTTGDYTTLSVRARANGVNTTSTGTSGVCVSGNFSASAVVNNYASLYGVQSYVQPLTYTNSNASNIACALYGKTDCHATYAGRTWVSWLDTSDTVVSGQGFYFQRMSHNGGAVNLDGFMTLYAGQGVNYLYNFENTNAPLAAADKTGGTKNMAIHVLVNNTSYWLQLYQS